MRGGSRDLEAASISHHGGARLAMITPRTTQLPRTGLFVTTVVPVKTTPSGNAEGHNVVAAHRAGTSSSIPLS